MNRRSGLTSLSRRRVLQAAAATGMLAAIERNFALAQSAPDYKALVCIFLEGGNDGENTLIRFDNAGYQNYASIRTPASGLNIPQGQLLPIQPASTGIAFGLNPACASLQTLFVQKKLAVIANVGPLVQPVAKFALEHQGAARPANLFSHSDQQRVVSTADASAQNRVGWGGRIADRSDAFNAGTLFPPLIATDVSGTFGNGFTSIPLTVPPGAVYSNVGTPDPQVDALAEATIREILAQQRTNIYDSVAQLYAEESLSANSIVAPVLHSATSAVRPFFANLNGNLALQLLNVALLIEARGQTGLRRQLFYVRHSGFDTHGSQPAIQHRLLDEFSKAMNALQGALAALNLGQNVTTFTLSDFGRTFKPAAGAGTDHGWGNYSLVIGDAVKGGDFYGKLPTQALDGPDDFGNAGRWIPTTSIEQYAATLARWFGIAEGDMPYILPNIGAFANTNLGFMS